MVIKEHHFDHTETQPYFRYWLLAIGAQIGDELSVKDYIIWNNQQAQAFKHSIGEREDKSLCHIYNGIECFSEYLKDLSK